MIMAPVGSSFIVSGSSMAIVAGGPRPGNTPMTVPSTTPITHITRLFGVNATWKPCSRPETMSTLEEDAAWQGELERHVEDEEQAAGAGQGHEERRAPALAAHRLHDEGREQREGNEE